MNIQYTAWNKTKLLIHLYLHRQQLVNLYATDDLIQQDKIT